MNTVRSRWVAWTLGIALLVEGGAALADPTAEDRAAADALFKEGRTLVKQGKYAEACPKLASSQSLDPATGTLLALADCYELAGQTASAWSTFNDAASAARRKDDKARAEEATRRAGVLEPKLSRLKIDIPAERRAPDMAVSRNGKPVNPSLVGVAFPVDPGEQVIEVTAPGRAPFKITVRVGAEPGVTTVDIPDLAQAVSSPPAPTASATAAAPTQTLSPSQAAPTASSSAPPSPGEPPSSGLGAQRIAGIAVGAAGVVGLVVGGVFGGLTFAQVGEANKECVPGDPPRCSSQRGVDLHREADTFANVSNVAIGAGGAAVITGTLLFLLAPSSPGAPGKSARLRPASPVSFRVLPDVGIGAAGLTLQGAF